MMKKYYLLGGMAAVAALFAVATAFPEFTDQVNLSQTPVNQTTDKLLANDSGAASVPYYSPAAATYDQIAEGWTFIDANNDSKYFSPTSEYSSPTGTAMKIGWTSSSTVPQDDYLIAPAVHLSAGTEYKVGYTWKSSSYGENATIYMSQSTDIDDIKASAVLHDFDTEKSSAYIKYWDTFTPSEEGDYYFVFYLHSGGDKGTVYFADLTILENKFAPAAVTGLKATPGADRALECKLEWTLPTVDAFGDAIPEDKPITAVKIYRDGEELTNVTLDGTATEFTDTEETGLTSGYHVYGVSVVADGTEGVCAEVGPTAYVGPLVPFSLPANFAISSKDDFSLWTTINDSKEWTYDGSYPYGARYQVNGNKNADNWLITPPVNIESEGYYRVTVTAFSTTNDKTSFEVCLLNSTDIEDAEKTVITDDWCLTQAYANSTSIKPVTTFDIKVTSTGTYYVGFHNKTAESSYATIYFPGVVIEKTSFVPGVVENLNAVPAADYSNTIEVSWENPTTSLSGDEITAADYQIEIYVNDAETPAATVDGGQSTASVNVEAPGVYTVTVKTVATDADHGTAPNAPSVTTTWVGSHEVALPYTTEFTQDDTTVAIWEIIDGNNDGVTFRHYATTYSHYMEFSTGMKEFKDYLLSPHMVLTPGFYQVAVDQNGTSSTIAHPTLGVIKAGTFDIDNIDMVSSCEINLNSYSVKTEMIVEIKEEGSYQVVYGLDQTFMSSYSSLKLNKLSVQGTEVLPGDVTDLQCVISGDNNDTVELSWTNPTTMFNSDIPMSSIDKIVVLRDNEELETITEGLTPGEAGSYTDMEVPGGTHTYTVKVVNAADKAHDGQFPTITTDWVGGGQQAPVDLIASQGRFPAWTFVDVDGNHGKDDMYTWKYFSQKYMIEGINYTNDDYLVSSPIAINANEVYMISYFMSAPMGDNPTAIDVAVKMGDYKDDATEYTTVHTINLPASRGFKYYSFYVAVESSEENEMKPADEDLMTLADGEEPTAQELYDMAAKLPAKGDFRVALHTTEKGGIDLTEFHFTKVAEFDDPTSLEKVESADKVTFDGNTIHFAGCADVTVYDLTGAVVSAATNVSGEYSVSGLACGCYIINVANATDKYTLKVVIK